MGDDIPIFFQFFFDFIIFFYIFTANYKKDTDHFILNLTDLDH